MSKQDADDFLKRLLSTFKIEAQEHINLLSAGLFELEKEMSANEQMELIEKIYREAHSLKGAARSVNANVIEDICQSLESGFALLKRNQIMVSPDLLNVLHQALDRLNYALSTVEKVHNADDRRQNKAIVQRLKEVFNPEPPESKTLDSLDSLKNVAEEDKYDGEFAETAADEEDFSNRTLLNRSTSENKEPARMVRISTTALDKLLLQSEELLSTKEVARQSLTDMEEIVGGFTVWKKKWLTTHKEAQIIERTLEPKTQEKGNSPTLRLIEFLNWNSDFIDLLESQMGMLIKRVENDQRTVEMLVDTLLEDVKRILMLPASTLLEVFPKLVRDLALDQGKEVELLIEGSEIEIDKRILEEIKDPLIHLIRNSIDHGIEKPEERKRKNKPPRGSLRLSIIQKSSNEIEMQIADDGAGIDIKKLKAAALKSNFISSEEADNLSDSEALELIFQSGMSTSPIITDISGRGLGLAIVREKVEKIGAMVNVETSPGGGTTFRFTLPITLATFRGVLVRLGEAHFVLPLMSVYRAVRVPKSEIRMVSNQETILLDDETVALVRLEDVIELDVQKSKLIEAQAKEYYHVIIVAQAHKKIGFVIDEILHEQEIIVKPLGRQLSRIRNIIGATLLGSGKVVPVLNVSDLLKSALRTDRTRSAISQTDATQENKKTVLIAEDTITSRTLLKNILMSAGYIVKTAVDGADAFRTLQNEDFDLLVSDIEMPRLNGFDLTMRIRADKKLAELPVVLVTSLDSREDRERGIDVGANAYVVKSSFDQSNLLEIVKRLI